MESITLFMVADNHFSVMLSVLLKSIEETHSGDETIDIYIVNDGISSKNVRKIHQTVTSEKINLFWQNIDDVIPSRVVLPDDKSTFPLNTYVRLLGEYFLPQHVKRAIYVDVDMIFLKDVSDLWKVDLQGRVIGAALDREKLVSFQWGGIRNFEKLGIPAESKYFNAGILLIDVEKWKKIKATELIIRIVNENADYASFPDQYGLNVLFANEWYELDPRWNSFAQDELTEPFLIHFTGVKPIFKGYRFNESYKNEFFAYLERTPYKGFTPKHNVASYLKKFYNLKSKKSWGSILNKSFTYAFKRLTTSR